MAAKYIVEDLKDVFRRAGRTRLQETSSHTLAQDADRRLQINSAARMRFLTRLHSAASADKL